MSASPLQTARVHQSVLNPFFHSNFVSRPMSGRLTLTAVTLHKKRTRLGLEKSDCSPAWSWSSFQHRAMRFLASTESPCGCRMGHTAAMAPRALCGATPSLLAQIRLETPHGGVRTPCAGELIPEISVLPSGEPRSPSYAEEDPAFLRSTDPDSLRSAGRCGIAPPPPTPSRSARGAVRGREPQSSLPTAPSGLPAEHRAEFSRREDGETFRGPPGPGSGETPRCPPPHARPALRAAHLRTPRRHRSVRRRQQPALFQTSAFPGSGAAPPAPSRGVRVGELPAGGPQGARILLPSPRSARPWGELSPPSPP